MAAAALSMQAEHHSQTTPLPGYYADTCGNRIITDNNATAYAMVPGRHGEQFAPGTRTLAALLECGLSHSPA